MPMVRDAKYSNRPWPKGWSLSGGRLLSLALIIEMADDPMSVRLLKASDKMAILLDIMPTANLLANKKRLQNMPRRPPRMLYFSRTFLSAVFS